MFSIFSVCFFFLCFLFLFFLCFPFFLFRFFFVVFRFSTRLLHFSLPSLLDFSLFFNVYFVFSNAFWDVFSSCFCCFSFVSLFLFLFGEERVSFCCVCMCVPLFFVFFFLFLKFFRPVRSTLFCWFSLPYCSYSSCSFYLSDSLYLFDSCCMCCSL